MSLTLAEARARAAQLSHVSYEIDLDVTDPATFRSRTTVRFDSTGPTTFLELQRARDLSVSVNGKPLAEPDYDGVRIQLADLREHNEVVVDGRIPYVTDGEGMHQFEDPADGERYVGAYLGMDVTQRVFASFDQVDLKAPLSVSVTADPAWTVVANGRTLRRDDAAAASTWVFATTPPIPCDLFVLCAGPWHVVSWEHRGLPFSWGARRSLAAELDRDADELKTTTTACFDHYTAMFDEPYAFDSFDQMFMPGLNWGAQEMPGCVIYRDEMLPAGRVTDAERSGRATVIAHEMAHMWFGDLVTMRWWEDTWLNESFADYMGFRVGADAAGFTGALVSFEGRRKPGAYIADRRRSTHPVAPLAEDVPDVEAAFANFDAISYAKGNAVLRQLVTWMGDDDFLAGVNAHLTRHRFANATLDDLVGALDDASDRDVRAWAEVWLRRTGFDTIRVERDESGVPVVVRDGVRPHRVRVTAYDDALAEVETRLIDLADERVRLDGWAGRVVVPNAHGETFARISLDDLSWDAVVARLSSLADPTARAVLWTAAIDLVHTRDLEPSGLLDLAMRHLPHEAEASLVNAVVGRTLTEVVPLRVPAADASQALASLAQACADGLAGGPDEQRAIAFASGLAATSSDAARLARWLDVGAADGVDLDPRLRWRVVQRLAEIGAIDADEIEGERSRGDSMAARLAAATALAVRPTDDAKAEAWEAMTTDENISNRMFESLATGLWSPEQADLIRPYVDAYLAETPALATRRGPGFAHVVGRVFPRVHLDDRQLDALRGALAGELPTMLRRHWDDALDDRV